MTGFAVPSMVDLVDEFIVRQSAESRDDADVRRVHGDMAVAEGSGCLQQGEAALSGHFIS